MYIGTWLGPAEHFIVSLRSYYKTVQASSNSTLAVLFRMFFEQSHIQRKIASSAFGSFIFSLCRSFISLSLTLDLCLYLYRKEFPTARSSYRLSIGRTRPEARSDWNAVHNKTAIHLSRKVACMNQTDESRSTMADLGLRAACCLLPSTARLQCTVSTIVRVYRTTDYLNFLATLVLQAWCLIAYSLRTSIVRNEVELSERDCTAFI